MGTSPTVAPRQVGILVLDNDPSGASAVKQVLDSEGWRVRVVPDPTYLAVNSFMFRASVMSERLMPKGWGVHLLGDLIRR